MYKERVRSLWVELKSVMDRFVCVRCGHCWWPRSDSLPLMCPRCKSYKWNEERKKEVVEG